MIFIKSVKRKLVKLQSHTRQTEWNSIFCIKLSSENKKRSRLYLSRRLQETSLNSFFQTDKNSTKLKISGIWIANIRMKILSKQACFLILKQRKHILMAFLIIRSREKLPQLWDKEIETINLGILTSQPQTKKKMSKIMISKTLFILLLEDVFFSKKELSWRKIKDFT